MSRRGVAAVLSFLVPGLGQLYNGDFFRALVWFFFALILDIKLFILSFGATSILSLLYHLWCAWAAYRRAEQKSRGLAVHA